MFERGDQAQPVWKTIGAGGSLTTVWLVDIKNIATNKGKGKKPIKSKEEIEKLILGVHLHWKNVVRF